MESIRTTKNHQSNSRCFDAGINSSYPQNIKSLKIIDDNASKCDTGRNTLRIYYLICSKPNSYNVNTLTIFSVGLPKPKLNYPLLVTRLTEIIGVKGFGYDLRLDRAIKME
jgi:hypothetical protein